jgi:hypothetical protein
MPVMSAEDQIVENVSRGEGTSRVDGWRFVRGGGGRRRVSRAVPIHRSQVRDW